MTWRPIETAPKDGKEIVLYFPPVKSGRSHMPRMFRVERMPWTSPRVPTHWMPLPEPPKETTE